MGDKSMDWKKAKTILILVFFILNTILAVVLYNNLKVEEVSKQIIDNTVEILKQNNVRIECTIPKDTGKDYTLQYEEMVFDKVKKMKIATILLGGNYTEVDNNSYKNGSKSLVFNSDSGFEFLDTGHNNVLKSASKADIDKYIKKESEELGLPFDEFKLDGYYPPIKPDDDETRVVYKGEFKGHAVFDNYIDIVVSKSAIKSVKYHYKKPISITVKDDTYVIPVYEILITKITKYPGIAITAVDMGFKGYTKVDKETKTLFEGLSWRIKTHAGKEYYFNARNGVEME